MTLILATEARPFPGQSGYVDPRARDAYRMLADDPSVNEVRDVVTDRFEVLRILEFENPLLSGSVSSTHLKILSRWYLLLTI